MHWPKSKGFVTWYALGKGWELFQKGVKWIPHNGESINFWEYFCVGKGPLRNLVHGPLDANQVGLKIADVWDNILGWDFDLLGITLPRDSVDLIRATPLNVIGTSSDSFTWGSSSNGTFNSSDAFNDTAYFANFPWNTVWKSNSLPRIVTFLLLLMHNRIACKILLFHRKIVATNLCDLCLLDVETPRHCVRDCLAAHDVWSHFPFVYPSFFSQSTDEWIATNLKSSLEVNSIPWHFIFPFVCWHIWKSRNEIIFRNNPKNPSLLAADALAKASEYFVGLVSKKHRTRSIIFPKWRAPPSGFFKLNTDGASLGNPGQAGAGGLIRVSNEKWMKGFSRKVGWASSVLAELWALRDGLKLAFDCHLAFDCNLKPIEVEVDAQVVQQMVNRVPNDAHAYHSIIVDCRRLMRILEVGMVHHTLREGNSCADAMAKIGLQSIDDDLILYEDPPQRLCSFLFMDFVGGTTPRFVRTAMSDG